MSNKNRISVSNPRTGEVDYYISPASVNDIANTCQHLRKNQENWRKAPLDTRITILRKFAEAITANAKTLTQALVNDTGRRGLSIMETGTIGPAIERWIKIAQDAQNPQQNRSSALPFIHYTIEKCPYALVGVV